MVDRWEEEEHMTGRMLKEVAKEEVEVVKSLQTRKRMLRRSGLDGFDIASRVHTEVPNRLLG
jgi:hypothetical protein